MGKRPLGLLCLAAAAVLYLFVHCKDFSYADYGALEGKTVTVTGKIYKKETVVRTNGPALVLYLKLNQESHAGASAGKRVICNLKQGQPEPEMGSYVQVQGTLMGFERASNPGQFDSCSYYQILAISYRLTQAEIKAKTTEYNRLTQGLFVLKGRFSRILTTYLGEEEASIMQTMLLGERSSMEKELKALYQRNGIAHILAISGLHVSMLGMGLYRLLRKCFVPLKAAAVLSAAVMILYGVMTGFSVSALRAILMFVIRMAAVVLERTYDMLTALALAAVLLLLDQPLYFFHSGFLFSFGCVLGIGLLLPVLTKTEKKLPKMAGNLLEGLGMAAVTLPVYLGFYYQYPAASIALNLLVIPMMSFLMGAGLLLIGFGMIFPPLTGPFAWLVTGVLCFYEKAMRLCDRMPFFLLTAGRPDTWKIVVYLAVLVFLVWLGKRIRLWARWGMIFLAAALLFYRPAPDMQLTFLDVGQGDSIFLANGNGNCYLIDGGSSSVNAVGEYRILPFLKHQGVSRLKAVFVTHPDEDHCSGIKELLTLGEVQGIRIEHLVLPDIAQEAREQSYLELVEMAADRHIPVAFISRGQKIEDGKLTLTCLHPGKGACTENANAYSTVLKVTYGNFSALLTGDVEGQGERELMQELEKEGGQGSVTVLKAAHHGSGSSTPEKLLEKLRPAYVVISCGRDNAYGHPHEDLLERIREQDAKTLITYETGAITFTTDAKKVSVSKFLSG